MSYAGPLEIKFESRLIICYNHRHNKGEILQ